MSEPVRVSKQNEIAVITIDNPPVNAISPAVQDGISSAIGQINADPTVKATVLIGAGRTFIAGADINEFVKMTSGKTKRTNFLPVLLQMEDCRVPVVVAIHGNALGGGLEIAMACHYRVASPDARVGQPEVNLGIIPGAGGTQRLPRLAGVAKAVEMCTTGKPIKAPEALQAGILDKLIDGDLLAGAVAFAREVAGKPLPKTRERNNKLGNAQENAPIFAAARDAVRKKQRGLPAPLAAIDAIEAATRLPFEKGCEEEARLFDQCLYSEQSKALIHVFFAEREVTKIPDVPKETPVLPVNSVAIVGAGTMGAAIAMVFVNAGIPVTIKDADQAAIDRGLANIQKNYAISVQRGRFTQDFVNERMKLITPTLKYESFADADLVIEAVFENLALKKEIFKELNRACKPGAILASNTSTLDLDEIAATITRPESVIGTHFFSPANVMRLLELVRGKRTSNEAIATCMQLAKKIGKVAALVRNGWGFAGNRMFMPYLSESQFLVEEGAAPEEVDAALTAWGMAMGPLAVSDLGGLDVAYLVRQERRHALKPGQRETFVEAKLVEMGRRGQKTGAGWYKYGDDRRAATDPEVAALVRKWSVEAGVPQRKISADEIVDRCVYRLVNEGAQILDDGIALRAGDLDTIYVNGYGFPAFRGGPMWYANTVGLKKVYERVREFHQQHGDIWQPAPLLKELAEAGKTFADFQREAAHAGD
ncbi:MAG TPA: 3-hydroxyacyl-CoA dehydrogenase NAD-binding domain-containing protein [Candidatus Dormibacteraeota bacterium]|nr:3-hydroxyacyl-CoA dehydrogenase NAD-binding domain-containing protein [Candidatus Dormibacteraeota bacterium]